MKKQQLPITDERVIELYVGYEMTLRGICRKYNMNMNSKYRLSEILRNHSIQITKGHKRKNGEQYVGDIVEFMCPKCKKTRMKKLRRKGDTVSMCGSCATKQSHEDNPKIPRAENHYNWKGGINYTPDGYIREYVSRDNEFFPMSSKVGGKRLGGYIMQHRLIMAKKLGRHLKTFEIVHHINGRKDDNRIENLKLTERTKHSLSYADAYSDGYKKGFADAIQKRDELNKSRCLEED